MICHKATSIFKAVTLSTTLLFSSIASAHTVWLEPINNKQNEFRVFFGGHAGKLETYLPEKLKTVNAVDANGNQLTIKKTIDNEGIILSFDDEPSLIAAHFDNGHFSYIGDSRRSIEKPMNQVDGATRGTRAVKYHKTIVKWSPEVLKVLGQPFEVVLLDSTPPQSNKPMRIQVLKDGKPVAGVVLGHGEEGSKNDPITDDNGVAEFIPTQGFNKLWAGKRYPTSNNPEYTELSYEFLLGFNVQ